MTALALIALACSDLGSLNPNPAVSTRAWGAVPSLGTVGTPLNPSPMVRVLDARGQPISAAAVEFVVTGGSGSVQHSLASTSPDGIAHPGLWTLGPIAGQNTLEARVSGTDALVFSVEGKPDKPTALEFVANPSEVMVGEKFGPPVRVRATDRFGNPVTHITVPVSMTMGKNPGSAALKGRTEKSTINSIAEFEDLFVDAVGDSFTIVASAPNLPPLESETFAVLSEPPAPKIESVAPGVIVRGGTITLSGYHFAPDREGNAVLFNGRQASVLSSGRNSLIAQVPDTGPDCEPPRAATITVVVGKKTASVAHPVVAADELIVAPGTQRVLGPVHSRLCVQLPADGEYLLSVFSADSDTRATTTYALRSLPVGSVSPLATNMTGATAIASWPRGRISPRVSIPPPLMGTHAIPEVLHDATLQRAAHVLRSHRPRAVAGTSAAAQIALSFLENVATVGATNEFRYSFTSCDSYSTILGRTAWVGEHLIIVEDTEPFGTPSLNGSLEQYYALLGAEFDRTSWPVIREYFGDPLAVDQLYSGHGKVIALFSPRVNANGVLGFVDGCDFFDRATYAKSNEAAIFYLRLPTTSGTGWTTAVPGGWYWITRASIVHEAKHLASYAERIRAGHPLEQPWIEEGGARIAEEIYGRTAYGNAWKDNTTYSRSVECDVRPDTPSCHGKPYVMARHFHSQMLFEFMANTDRRSVLCHTSCVNPSYYGSAWALLRWSADQFALDEREFFRRMTRSPLVGVANLQSNTGQEWADILSSWSFALGQDDAVPGAERGTSSFPSWDLRDIFAGLHRDSPSSYTVEYPLLARAVPPMESRVRSEIVNGGFTLLKLDSRSSSWLVAVEAENVVEATPANLRIGVLRVR